MEHLLLFPTYSSIYVKLQDFNEFMSKAKYNVHMLKIKVTETF